MLQDEFRYRTGSYDGRSVQIPIPNYQYLPFKAGGDEFRLLEVFPDQFDAPIRCRIVQCSLNDAPVYAALSYLWGNPSICDCIIVDDEEFPVTTNLRRALQQLRRNSIKILLWVDAICIDQNSDIEKSVHVPKMSLIYHDADYVLVWLGLHAHGSQRIMKMLKKIDDSRRPSSLRERREWVPHSEDLERYQPEIKAFIRRRYWRRCWIVQEVAQGTRVQLICGSSDPVRWEAFVLFMEQVDKESHLAGPAIEHIQGLCRNRKSIIASAPISLLRVLHETYNTEASEPRDKVFSVLGLAFDGDKYVKSANYGCSDRQVCLEMTQEVMWSKKSLDIIFAASLDPVLALPSWCPDYLHWAPDAPTESLISYLSGQDLLFRDNSRRPRWRATSDSPADRAIIKIDRNMLLTRGVFIGRLNGLGCVLVDDKPPKYGGYHSRRKRTDRDIFESLTRALTLYGVDEGQQSTSKGRDIGRFFYHLYEFEDKKKAAANRKYFERKYSNIIKWRKKNKRFRICGKTLVKRSHDYKASWYTGALAESAGEGLAAAFNEALSQHPKASKRRLPADLDGELMNLQLLLNEGMRLMTTDDDDLGWAHPAAHIGDSVFLLYGCSMPAVLRRNDEPRGTFSVVGHAYVEGVMNGEKWDLYEEKDMEDVWLC